MDESITIRINADTKARAQELFSSLGMDMDTAVNLFINQAIEFQGIPFAVRRYNEETEKAIYESHNGINMVGPFNSVSELKEALDADD